MYSRVIHAHVYNFSDSSAQRVHIAIIAALDEMKDVNTIANLLSVPDACDVFWREAHSRNKEVSVISAMIPCRFDGA